MTALRQIPGAGAGLAGAMCKPCINRSFWQSTLVTLCAGWWSLMGIFATPIIVIHNVIRYLLCAGLSPVRPGTPLPELTEATVDALRDKDARIRASLDPECDLQAVVTRLAADLSVNPGAIMLYVHCFHADRLRAEHHMG